MDNRKSTFGFNLYTPAAGTTNRPSIFAKSGHRNQHQQDFRPSIAGNEIGRISLADARSSFARAPSFGARQSNFPGMTGRQSLAVPRILNQNEQRNIRDKQVQNEMIRKIQDFLADCYNPQPPFKFDDHNFLRVPGRTEFKNVFEFLMQQLQPSFQMVKFDEDKLLKVVNNLGYPYPFKLNTLKTMTGTTWPTMLSVLDWLIDIIELDNQMHSKNKIRDVAKWQLLVSCYKRDMNVRGRGNNTAAIPKPEFDEEFEAYKQSKLGEDERPDSYEERRVRRMAFEKKREDIDKCIMEEKEKIAEIQRSTDDLKTDIAALLKYNDDLVIKTSQIEQLLIQATEIHETLGRTIEKLNAENAEKERQIAGQKISGNEARQLLTERNSIREEIGLIRERMGKVESEIFEIQPNFFKISAQIRSDYSALLSGLKGLCETFCNTVDAQKIIDSLDQQSFEQIFEDIQKTDINDNKLSKLIGHLKELCERRMLAYKQNEEEANQHMENLQKEIRELQSTKEQRRTKHELEIERAIRERDDKLCPENVQKHNLDLIRKKRQTTAEALNKHTGQLNELHEKLAEKHKQYIDFKRQLDSKYNDLQSVHLEQISKLCERIQQIEDQKERYKELGEQMLKGNKETLKKLKGGSKGSKH